jgi:hypothetical protein
MPLAEKGVRGKGRQPLSPPQHVETARSAGDIRSNHGPTSAPFELRAGEGCKHPHEWVARVRSAVTRTITSRAAKHHTIAFRRTRATKNTGLLRITLPTTSPGRRTSEPIIPEPKLPLGRIKKNPKACQATKLSQNQMRRVDIRRQFRLATWHFFRHDRISESCVFDYGHYGFGFPRFLRMESPRISMRWAL